MSVAKLDRLGRYDNREVRNRLVIFEEAPGLQRLEAIKIGSPTIPDGLIEKRYRKGVRPRRPLEIDRILHPVAPIDKVLIFKGLAAHDDVGKGRRFLETGGQEPIVLQIPRGAAPRGGGGRRARRGGKPVGNLCPASFSTTTSRIRRVLERVTFSTPSV